MSITFSQLSNTLGTTVTAKQQELETFIGSMDPTDTSSLIKLQQMQQEWTMLIQLQSTLIKDIGDALKGIVQKAS
ncbi:MAG TPA: EscF/YscF/HrpA family type III secretion system needle major subunit [Magnetospirillum sp.]|nr:EscF/YscF/HrpA family type III secretion system needle major subunit [Magnetospirillum sp.]